MTLVTRDAIRSGRKVIKGNVFGEKTPEVTRTFTAQKNESFDGRDSFAPDFQGGPSGIPLTAPRQN